MISPFSLAGKGLSSLTTMGCTICTFFRVSVRVKLHQGAMQVLVFMQDVVHIFRRETHYGSGSNGPRDPV
jgi:hypothetical protein